MRGTIQRFSARNGWGWIDVPARAAVFVHLADVDDLYWYGAPVIGQSVEFDLGSDDKGRSRALRVRRVSPSLLARLRRWLTRRFWTWALSVRRRSGAGGRLRLRCL